MVLVEFLIAVLFVIVISVLCIYHRVCVNELKRIDHETTIANIRIEPSEADFRKFFESPTEQFQQFVKNSEDRRRRVILRRLSALRVVACVWCIFFAITCVVFFSSCTTTRSLSNTYNVTLDTLQYKFNFEHSENVSAKRN